MLFCGWPHGAGGVMAPIGVGCLGTVPCYYFVTRRLLSLSD